MLIKGLRHGTAMTMSSRTLAEDSVVRQELYKPSHFGETNDRTGFSWIIQIIQTSTSWESTLNRATFKTCRKPDLRGWYLQDRHPQSRCRREHS